MAMVRSTCPEFLFTKIEEEDIGNIWFQQDGARCLEAEATLDVLRPIPILCLESTQWA